MLKIFAFLACSLSCSLLITACGVEVDEGTDETVTVAPEAAPLAADVTIVTTPQPTKCDSQGNTCQAGWKCCYNLLNEFTHCAGPGHDCPKD